jgi:hypothetical protein
VQVRLLGPVDVVHGHPQLDLQRRKSQLLRMSGAAQREIVSIGRLVERCGEKRCR